MKRVFLIRHVRYFWHSWRADVWARKWASMGVGLGFINENDRKMLDAIWKGEA